MMESTLMERTGLLMARGGRLRNVGGASIVCRGKATCSAVAGEELSTLRGVRTAVREEGTGMVSAAGDSCRCGDGADLVCAARNPHGMAANKSR